MYSQEALVNVEGVMVETSDLMGSSGVESLIDYTDGKFFNKTLRDMQTTKVIGLSLWSVGLISVASCL